MKSEEESIWNQNKKSYLISGICYLVGLLSLLVVDDVDTIVGLDNFRQTMPALNAFVLFTTDFIVYGGIALIAIGLIGSFFHKSLKEHKLWFLTVALTLGLSALFVNVTKIIVQRPRPFADPVVSQLFTEIKTSSHYSFPSGHSAAQWSMSYPAFFKVGHWLLKGFMILAGIWIPFTRIYLGVHYYSDVIVGSILGCITWQILEYLLALRKSKKDLER